MQHAGKLAQVLQSQAWDGEWYLRAFYDDDLKMGSHESIECQINLIVQSWAVLSGTAKSDRAVLAMESVNKWLVK